MLSDLGLFLFALFQNWTALLTGGVLGGALLLVERLRKKEVPWKWFTAIVAFALLCACFLAWQDEHTKARDSERGQASLRAALQAEQAANREKEKRISDMQMILNRNLLTKPIDLAPIVQAIAKLQGQEGAARSPLQAKIASLSRRILAFVVTKSPQMPKRPPQSIEDLEVSRKQMDAIGNEFSVKFGIEVASVLSQLKAKGIEDEKTAWLCGGASFGPLETIRQCAIGIGVMGEQLP